MALTFKKMGKSLASAVGKGDPYYAVYQSLADVAKLEPDSAERRRLIDEINGQLYEMEQAAQAERPQDGAKLKKIWVLRQYFWALALRDPKTPANMQQNTWRRIYEDIYSFGSPHRAWYNDPSTTVQATRKSLESELQKLQTNAITRRRQQAAAASAAAMPGQVDRLLTALNIVRLRQGMPQVPTHTPGLPPPGSLKGGKKTRKQRRNRKYRKASTYRHRR